MSAAGPEPERSPGTTVPGGDQSAWPSADGGEAWEPPAVDAPDWLPPTLDAPVLEPLTPSPAPSHEEARAAPAFGAEPAGARTSTRRRRQPGESHGTGREVFASPEGQEPQSGAMGPRAPHGAGAPLRVAAALLSVVIPGAGLFLRRQLKAGLIVLLGSVGCAAAGIGLAYAQDALDSVALAFAMLGFLLAAVVLYLAGIVASAWPSTDDDVPRRMADPISDGTGLAPGRPKRRASLRRGSRPERPVTSTETLLGLVMIVGVIVVVVGWLTAIVWLAVDGEWAAAGGVLILPLAVVVYLFR
jgi:hypothetical protein